MKKVIIGKEKHDILGEGPNIRPVVRTSGRRIKGVGSKQAGQQVRPGRQADYQTRDYQTARRQRGNNGAMGISPALRQEWQKRVQAGSAA